jgi:hypothetical protein
MGYFKIEVGYGKEDGRSRTNWFMRWAQLGVGKINYFTEVATRKGHFTTPRSIHGRAC